MFAQFILWLTGLIVILRRVLWQWEAGKPRSTAGSEVVHSTEKIKFGVTLSGGEFTPGGAYDLNYGYPPLSIIDYYASQGMKVIRLPFLWERVQPVMYGPLDALEMSRIDPVVDYALSKGFEVAVDVHNGGMGFGHPIGHPDTPNEAFADLWGKLAAHYKDRPGCLMAVMSEPSKQSACQWLASANAAIAAIRAAGSTQTIIVPGSYFDGGWTWTVSDNAEVVGAGVVDPLDNYLFEIHQYLDGDGSGGTSGIVSPDIGVQRLMAATEWARASGKKFFLGEFGTGSDPASMEALDNMLSYLQKNSDVWPYACWWGAGDRFYDYFMSIEPTNYANPSDKPQMTVLRKYI